MVKLKSVLIIDNDETSNFIMQFVLRATGGFDVLETVKDGKEACDYFLKNRDQLPELVFLDLYMPGLDGQGFLQWYEDNGFKGSSKIVVISSSIMVEDKEKVMGYVDVIDFVDKPLTKETVNKILSTFE